MSAAPVAVASASEGPPLSSSPPKGATEDAQSAESGPGPSFTEVLSQQERGAPGGREKNDGNPGHGAAAQARGHSSHLKREEPAGTADAPPPSADLQVDDLASVGVAPAAAPAVDESTGRTDPAPAGRPSPRIEVLPAESPDVLAPPTASKTELPDAGAVAATDPGHETHRPADLPSPTASAVIGEPTTGQPTTVVVTPSSPPAPPVTHQNRGQEGSTLSTPSADRSETLPPAHVGPTATPNPSVHSTLPGADRSGPAPLASSHFLNEGSGAPHESTAVSAGARAGDPAAFSSSEDSPAALDVDGLSSSISRPLSDGSGTYTVAVAMHPSDLGHLHAVMSLEGNDLQVLITPQTRMGHDALTNAADALKNQLASAGLNVNVTLRDPGSSSGGDDRFEGPTSGDSTDVGSATPRHSPMPVLVSGQIHLVL
jgi:hypothetical protein